MGESKNDKVGQIECLLCNEYFWYIHPSHLESQHGMGYEEYKQWVAEEHGLDEDAPILEDDTVISPNKWSEQEDDSDLPIGFVPK